MSNKEVVSSNEIQVLYGTDQASQLSDNKISYIGEFDTALYRVGYIKIKIPKNHLAGSTIKSTFWKLELNTKHPELKDSGNIVKLSENAFNTMIHDVKRGTDAFIFIHGYNNSFEDAAYRAAQLSEDLHLENLAPIMFSWPSKCKTLAYLDDYQNVDIAVPALQAFLKRIAKEGKFRKIHVIAHSMGNRLLCLALAGMKGDTANLHIDQVVMAAPDVDPVIFKRDFANEMVARAKKITIYAAKNDEAMVLSNKISNRLRLGAVVSPPYLVDSIDIIDATEVKTDLLGHGRFAQSEAVMNDINKLFTDGHSPAMRGVPQDSIVFDNIKLPHYYFLKWGKQ